MSDHGWSDSLVVGNALSAAHFVQVLKALSREKLLQDDSEVGFKKCRKLNVEDHEVGEDFSLL